MEANSQVTKKFFKDKHLNQPATATEWNLTKMGAHV